MMLKMCLVSIMAIFEYILDMSMETNVYVGRIGVSLKACINCVVFLMLNMYGRGVLCKVLIICMLGCFANLQWGGWVG